METTNPRPYPGLLSPSGQYWDSKQQSSFRTYVRRVAKEFWRPIIEAGERGEYKDSRKMTYEEYTKLKSDKL